jgi:DNA-directed RNA polymerase subunit beta'
VDTKVTNFKSILLRLASPEKILSWSHGEVTKPETINYRTQRSERDGLFDERIFGPEKDNECYCGKYRRVRYKGIICEKCGVEVTRSIVRRERMGHIELASPVSHIWFLRGIPSRIGLLLNLSINDLEKVIYFAGYIITHINEERKSDLVKNLEKEFKTKVKNATTKKEKDNLKNAVDNARKELADLKIYKILSEVEYHRFSLKYGDIFEADIGAEALYNICKSIDLLKLKEEILKELDSASFQNRKKILKRLTFIKAMINSNIRPEWMFLKVIPVIPPALRPMVALDGGRHATSDVNDLYRRVINRNNRLKKLIELKAPEVIKRNEKRMLQEAVDALIDNSIRRGQGAAISQAQRRPLRSLADMLKGKQGRFRQNLLGKRVDYSGRSVIVVGPELKLHQCGLPKHMALELFRPFVIQKLIERGLSYNIKGAGRLIEEEVAEVWQILEEVIKDKHVLLNRAPTLHRLGIQAFQPVLIEGNAIQIHPLVCQAFNADFDGDQMAVHIPLTREAQYEAKEIMASNKNLLKPGTGDPVVSPVQDMVLGCYWLTKIIPASKGEDLYFSSPNEAITSYEAGVIDLRAKINVKVTDIPKYKGCDPIVKTSAGRLLFNSILPEDFNFINDEISRKTLSSIVNQLIIKFGADMVPSIIDKVKEFGFRYATRSGISWGIDDLRIPAEKREIIKAAENEALLIQKHYEEGLLTDEERYTKIIEIWTGANSKVSNLVPKTLDEFGSIYSMISSNARGSWTQVAQMSGMKGLVSSPSGRTIELPILSSYKEGLNPLEYFISTHGARKGTADTALKTAVAGYLTRRLVDVAQEITVMEKDCKATEGIKVRRADVEEYSKSFASRIFGRSLLHGIKDSKGKILFKKDHILTLNDAEYLDKHADVQELEIRSPIYCKTPRGVCQMCYGFDLSSNFLVKLGEAVGVVAAQAIGEPGTQLTMRTFHIGGVVEESGDITMGLPRVEEIFETRTPKNPAVLSDVNGQVIEIKNEGKEKKITVLIDREQKELQKNPKDSHKDKKDTKEFLIPFGRNLLVGEEDYVTAGQALSDGACDVKELFSLGGKQLSQEYILKEVSKIYFFQGAPINAKHIEIIIRQMFSRVRIADPGSSRFATGDIIEKAEFMEENDRIKKTNGKLIEAKEIVMNITKVALTTSSFLAAASFQDTGRILIKSAIEVREDKLRGLKENVIIGRLIPAGTNFRKEFKKKV